jgi:hypothetical protein
VVSAAAVPKAGDVADEDLVRPEGVSIRAAVRRVGDPFPGRGLHQLAQHGSSLGSGLPAVAGDA